MTSRKAGALCAVRSEAGASEREIELYRLFCMLHLAEVFNLPAFPAEIGSSLFGRFLQGFTGVKVSVATLLVVC